jgi:SAM-dependent methyltransferase
MNSIKESIKKIPGVLPVWNKVGEWRLKKQSPEKVFTDIYRKNSWGNGESVSGSGSNLTETASLRKNLEKLFKDIKVSSILDIPCGDFHWMSLVDKGSASYIGADIVEPLVKKNSDKYVAPGVEFRRLDLVNDALPRADLVICRDCLVHLSFEDVLAALRNIVKSGSTYLIATTFPEHAVNTDIVTGRWRTLNMNAAPFNLPKPIMMLHEDSTEVDMETRERYDDKSLGLWQIADIQNILKS